MASRRSRPTATPATPATPAASTVSPLSPWRRWCSCSGANGACAGTFRTRPHPGHDRGRGEHLGEPALWTQPEPQFRGRHYNLGRPFSSRNRSRSPIPRSWWAARAPRPCAAPPARATAGTRSGTSPESARAHIAKLTELRAEYGRADAPSEVTVNGSASMKREQAAQLVEAGVDRIVTTLWSSSRDAIPALEAFAARVF